MKLILAQGNIGSKYNHTRHNIGFRVIDDIAKNYHGIWSEKPAFRGVVCELRINGEKVLLVKPTTFYNLTGFTLQAITNFYKLDPKTDLLVLHDDLSINFGVVKTRSSGSAGGNKGLQSIIGQIGVDFHRVKIGINSDQRCAMAKSDYVLSCFNKDEQSCIDSISNQVQVLVQNFINNSFENSTYRLLQKTKTT